MSVRWDTSRHNVRWRFRRIDFPSLEEIGEYSCITGGSGEFSALNDMKMTGTLEIDGEVPDENDLIGVSYSFTDDDGNESGDIPIAMYVVSVPEPIHRATEDGERVSGSIECTSILSVLQGKMLRTPLVLSSGTDAISLCVQMVEECRLKHNNPLSSYRTSRDREYEIGETYLSVINDLLDIAGYRAIFPDEYGKVIMEEYESPFDTQSVWTFERGKSAIHMRTIPFTTNYRDTPTTVIGKYATENYTVVSIAENVDADSPSSVANRGGREFDELYDIQEVTSTTKTAIKNEVARETLSKLKNNSKEIQYKTITHLLAPIKVNDAITLIDQSVDFKGAITNISMQFDATAMCTTKARTFVKYNLDVTQETHWYGANP